jgi:carboxymethylenebutenolidase
MGQEIRIGASDSSGDFMGYLATPASGTGAGVLVIQEIFGVNHDVRAKCDAWAAAGYIALAPDLFWRQQPGVALNTLDEAEWQQAFGFYNGFDIDAGVADLQASINALRARSTGNVGTVGFCLGGCLAYLCAARTDADANVGYYGVGIEKRLDEAAHIRKPLMLHIAAADSFVSAEAQAAIHRGLDAHPQVSLYDYAGQEHAFSRIGGTHYDAASAALAQERTAALFSKHLQ